MPLQRALAGEPERRPTTAALRDALIDAAQRLGIEPGPLGGRCRVFGSDQRVRSREWRYVCPDLSVVCGAPVIEHDDVLVNPAIVVEVLSSTTEQYDRGLKWDGYQMLPSLTDYVLVSQDRAHIEHFARSSDGQWVYTSANAGERIRLLGGTQLDVDAIFAGVLELPGD